MSSFMLLIMVFLSLYEFCPNGVPGSHLGCLHIAPLYLVCFFSALRFCLSFSSVWLDCKSICWFCLPVVTVYLFFFFFLTVYLIVLSSQCSFLHVFLSAFCSCLAVFLSAQCSSLHMQLLSHSDWSTDLNVFLSV